MAEAPAGPRGGVAWLSDWDEAMGRARATRRPVLIDVSQDN